MTIKEEFLQSISLFIDKKLEVYKMDKTFSSVIKEVNPNGTYLIRDLTGIDRTVKCCIPNLDLKIGQSVYVKIPMSNIKKMHICGTL